MNKKKTYNKIPKAKGRWLLANMSHFHNMGLVLVDAKTSNQCGQVPLHEDAKSVVGGVEVAGGNTVAQRPPTCFICKQVGHNQRQCLMSPMSNRSKAELV